MRIDHHAYQRGTHVAAFGLGLQAAIGLTLLIFSRIDGQQDTSLYFASLYILIGTLVWLSLIVIQHQHKLERLEALEEDELAAAQTGTSSIFDAAPDEQRVAARRLALMYRWFLPIASLLIAGLLVVLWLLMWGYFRRLDDPITAGGTEFLLTNRVGWAVAICFAIALISFIFSRFVAGMAKLEVWQNLRGGAGYSVGTALVMLAIGAGMVFRIFDNHDLIEWIAYALPWFMLLVAAEIVLNFILALYRPRVAGETPRAAFDSRVLSLLAAPDSIVRSLGDAVNYQFGFDVASSWGYQLLLRSFVWLVAIGAGVLVLLNAMVVVEPHQQAVRLQHGRIVGDLHESGVLWKYPWPVQTARIYDVNRVRELSLTARVQRPDIDLWTSGIRTETDREIEPFIVGSALLDLDLRESEDPDTIDGIRGVPNDLLGEDGEFLLEGMAADPDADVEEVIRAASRVVSLVDAEIALQYRIRVSDDAAQPGLLNYLTFAQDEYQVRRDGLSTAQWIIRTIALREVTQQLSTMSLEEVLSIKRAELSRQLRGRIQAALDAPNIQAGVEVLAVNLLTLRPSGQAARDWEDLNMSKQGRTELVAKAQRNQLTSLTVLAGDPERARQILQKLEELEDLEHELGRTAPEVIELESSIERMMRESGGRARLILAEAEADRWVELMSTQAQASRTRSQALSYHASPLLYTHREWLRAWIRGTGGARKYVIGIDPQRFHLDVELKELSTIVDFATAVTTDGE